MTRIKKMSESAGKNFQKLTSEAGKAIGKHSGPAAALKASLKSRGGKAHNASEKAGDTFNKLMNASGNRFKAGMGYKNKRKRLRS